MRSSTCLSRTSCAGGCTFCCLSCCRTIRLASSRSYWVMASSLTTATTRSTLTTRCRQPLTDDAKRPAPGIVLEPRYTLQGFAVDERIVPAPDHRPAIQKRPLPGEIDLFQLGRISSRIDLLADVTVACVEHTPGTR